MGRGTVQDGGTTLLVYLLPNCFADLMGTYTFCERYLKGMDSEGSSRGESFKTFERLHNKGPSSTKEKEGKVISSHGTMPCFTKPSPPKESNNQTITTTMRKESRTVPLSIKTDASTSSQLRQIAQSQGKRISTVANDLIRASLNQSAPNR